MFGKKFFCNPNKARTPNPAINSIIMFTANGNFIKYVINFFIFIDIGGQQADVRINFSTN